ncbi:hypothetical protein HanXRQr2_Chr07g0304131 [Helianthus annuus]|uniref:Uncharacterized protein n=1 Tax=Helianthus annuus TaxID=4232 RepID=A0A9K3NH04_HELAN|nr:hypothetical protein HanXRQr2_Chr07g0304131 [Helianthus annuus]KAJ0905481.1 hypothetical protein HanPSC8_Chr07g0294501 [Helianthus annuus]
MGTIIKFSLDGSSCNNLLINFSLSPSRPTTSDSSKDVSFLLLVFFGFSSFTIKPRSPFCFSRCCNWVVILSNLGDNL